MNQSICKGLLCCVGLLCFAGHAAAEDKWELGFSGGYGIAKDVQISNASGSVSAGLKPGAAMSVFGGNQVLPWLSGELRYTYRQNGLQLSGSASEATFSGE